MFNDTSGHGTCTNYAPLKCQKCMWEGSLIQTFRAALCLEWSSAASSTQKTSDGHPWHTANSVLCTSLASACFLFLRVCFDLQLPHHFCMSSGISSFSTQNLWPSDKGTTSSFVWGFRASGSQLSREMGTGLCNCIQ